MAFSNPKNALGELSAAMEVESGNSMKSLEAAANAYSSHAFIHSQTILPPVSSFEKECGVRDVHCYLDSKGAQAKVLADDFQRVTNLKNVSCDADSFIAFLYSHRALAPCLPQITESRKDQTESIYNAWIAILQPFADKLSDLYTFTKSAVGIVRDEMTVFLQQSESKVAYSSERLWNLAVVIDRLYLIDSLKSVKASINNDFSAFKRAALSRAALGVSAADRLEQAQLHMDLGQYLANKGSVLRMLKEQVFLVRHGSQSFVHVIAELLRYTIPALAATVAGGSADGAECHLLPAERHSLLRVVPICMVLLGPEEKEVRDILQDKGSLGKELQLQKLLKEAVDLLKSNPVGPLYADMPVVVHSVLLEAAWFPKLADTFFTGLVNPSEMTDAEAAAVNQRYDLREHLQRLRRQYAMTLSRFHCMSLALQASQADAGEAWRPEILQEGYTATLEVLKTLAAMCALTIEQAAWKCCRPAKSGGISAGPGKEKDLDEELICRYDRMVKFNYHPTELDAILEVLVMSLNLGHCLKSKRTTVISLVKRYMHGETQSMMQERLTGMFTHAAKNKKREMLDMLTTLRKLGADWKEGREPACPELEGKAGPKHEWIQRSLAPSATQIALIRHLVQTVCAYAQAHRGGMFAADSLPKDDVRALSAWGEATRPWALVLALDETLAAATDLSSLYLREYALELVRKTQFPMSSSLPWLLAAHAVQSKSHFLLPASILPLLVYNQAGHRAVVELRRAHLVREIKAETDIAYDQLVWKLARRMVLLAKVAAAGDLFEQLTPNFPRRNAAGECVGLEQLARHAELQLVGEEGGELTTRVRRIRRLLGMRAVELLVQGVHYALLRFEAEGLRAAEELAALLSVHRLALHRLAAAGVAVGPPAEAWRGVWGEAGEGGERVCRQVTLELYDELFPCAMLHYASATFVPLPAECSSRPPFPRDEFRSDLKTFEEQHVKDLGGGEAWRVQGAGEEGEAGREALLLFGSKAATRALLGPASRLRAARHGGIGLPQLRAISDVVGFDRLAAIAAAAAQRAAQVFSQDLMPYVATARKGVARDLKLPSQQYGAEGVLAYFEAKGQDLASYPPLPLIYRFFREVGNALGFLDLVDGLAGESALRGRLQLGPLHPGGGADADPGRLAAAVLKGLGDSASSDAEEVRTAADRVEWQRWQGATGRAGPCEWLEAGVRGVHAALGPWAVALRGGVGPDGVPGGLLPSAGGWGAGGEVELCRVWGLLEFLAALPPAPPKHHAHDTPAPQDRGAELLGDGWLWTGATMLHVLRQTHRLALFHPVGHVESCHRAAAPGAAVSFRLSSFLAAAGRNREVTSAMLQRLQTAYPLRPAPIVPLQPPPDDRGPQRLVVSTDLAPAQTPVPAPSAAPAGPPGFTDSARPKSAKPPPPSAPPPPRPATSSAGSAAASASPAPAPAPAMDPAPTPTPAPAPAPAPTGEVSAPEPPPKAPPPPPALTKPPPPLAKPPPPPGRPPGFKPPPPPPR